MANTKKKVVEEEQVTPKVENVIKDVIEEVVKETPKTKVEKVSPKRELTPTTTVMCMNNTVGGLTFRSIYGGRGFRSQGYGKPIRIQLQDLENLYNEQPDIITQGWLYILDQDVVEALYLEELYESLISPKDIDNFIKLPEDEIKEKLENAPRSMKTTMFNVLKKKIQDGDQELQYVPRRRFFEEVLGAKFEV